MIPFTYQRGNSKELEFFTHIIEFSLSKNSTVQLDSFTTRICDDLRIYAVVEGKFDWVIDRQSHTLYPGDVVLALPGCEIGGVNGVFGIGAVYRLSISVEQTTGSLLGKWSGLAGGDGLTILNDLSARRAHALKVRGAAEIFQEIRNDIVTRDIGYLIRVNHLIDLLLINIVRQSSRLPDSHTDFERAFKSLEQTLRRKPAHQWTVEEMAAIFGLGTTAFTEKVKSHTGFSPLNYLINIRISEAMKLLQNPHANITNIALETGFYSSQHFSTTFKKLTGYTPGEFRRINESGRGPAVVSPV